MSCVMFSGFYSVSGSSLSDSCYSVSSEVAQGQVPARPQRLWEQCPLPNSAGLSWSDAAGPSSEAECSHEAADETLTSGEYKTITFDEEMS